MSDEFEVVGPRNESVEKIKQKMMILEKMHEEDWVKMEERLYSCEADTYALLEDVAALKATAVTEGDRAKVLKLEGKCELLMEMVEKRDKTIQTLTQQLKGQVLKNTKHNHKLAKATPLENTGQQGSTGLYSWTHSQPPPTRVSNPSSANLGPTHWCYGELRDGKYHPQLIPIPDYLRSAK